MRLRGLKPIALAGLLASGAWAASAPPAAAATSTCTAIPVVSGQWNTGFILEFEITNTGSTAINGWIVTFDLPVSDQIAAGWGATIVQNGQKVTATDNQPYNTTIPPGATANAFGVTVVGSDTRITDVTCQATG